MGNQLSTKYGYFAESTKLHHRLLLLVAACAITFTNAKISTHNNFTKGA